MKPIYKAIFLISFFMFSNLCFGGVVWSWKINNPNIVTDGSENIVFTATIFNHENSEVLKEIDTNLPNEVEALSFLVLDFDNDVFDKYIYDIGELGSGTIRSQFSDVVIESGESFNFILYTLVPRSSDLSNGIYEVDVNTMILNESSQGFIDFGLTNISIVPLPGGFVLFLSALFGLYFQRKL